MRLLNGPQEAYSACRASLQSGATFEVWDKLALASDLASIYRCREETVRLAGFPTDSYRVAVDALAALGDQQLRLGVVRPVGMFSRFVLFLAADASAIVACIGRDRS
ncbi:hypothetical protein GCM10027290_66410 [Micromonospora sonneratiae]